MLMAIGARTLQFFQDAGRFARFGGAIATVSCYKGFSCKEGAHGVGQACTEAFVLSFVSILALDFALAVIAKAVYQSFWPIKGIVGG